MASKRRLHRAARRRTEVRAYVAAMHRCRCGKVRGHNGADAEHKHALAAAHNGWQNAVRFYACTFGGWHWTSRLDGSAWARPAKPAKPSDGLTPDQRAWLAELAELAA